MKRKIILSLSLILYILLVPTIFCSGLFIYDWIQADAAHNSWLSQDNLRMNFTPYETCVDVRKALLERFPLETPETDLKAFFLANRVQGPYKNDEWQPSDMGYRRCGSPAPSPNRYGVKLQVHSGDGGHIFTRIFGGTWVIFFDLYWILFENYTFLG